MLCTNAMVVDAWKGNPYPAYVDCQDGLLEAQEIADKVDDNIPTYPQRKSSSLTRSTSCNRVNLPIPSRKPKRSLSTSGTQRPQVHLKRNSSPEVAASTTNLSVEPAKGKLKRSNSVLSRLARNYSFRTRRSSSTSSKEMNPSEDDGSTVVVTKERRRRRSKSAKKDGKLISAPARLLIPKLKSMRNHSPEPARLNNSQPNGEVVNYQTELTVSPPTPEAVENTAASPDEPASPTPEDKSYDSGRMSVSSFRSFSSGRPTSMSSVTSSISSRTSRGSDYFSSASSGGGDQQNQITSHRFGLQTVLPDLNESEAPDRTSKDLDAGTATTANLDTVESPHRANSARSSRSSAFIAHCGGHNRDLNDVDHLAPVANLAMVDNPDLSYVDRVLLELIETERMYVRSMRDILTGYLSVIRSNPGLNIQPGDVDDLFGNIRDIYDFNRNLLAELEDCEGDPQRVAGCFASRADDYKVYTEYCTNYPSSVAAMTRCMKNPHLADFFKAQQDCLRHTLPLGSYLLKPVQRVLKYHLLLQELVKHCDKTDPGYQTIEKALQTMTGVARHINDMKRKHEDAVYIQVIQSLLTNWQGSELTTYGELILESEMKMQGAKNERHVFLFEKMILITKRREDNFHVCKASIMCSELVMLESVPNTPLGFQIQAQTKCARKTANHAQQEQARSPFYVLLARNQEEKDQWTYQIKHLIINSLKKSVPSDARDRLLRPVRDGDGEDDGEERKIPRSMKPRFGSNTLLAAPEARPGKSGLLRLTSNPGASNVQSATQPKPRMRSESMSRKTLHKKALQRRKEEMESSDDVSAESNPNTPSAQKAPGKFSFPSFRQSSRATLVSHASKPASAHAQLKANGGKPNAEIKKSMSMKSAELKKSTSHENGGEVTKRKQTNSVIYRRHKRRTSQPVTFTEKRLSMKITEEDLEGSANGDQQDEEDFLNFNPLTARESVSWDIQIVQAVFERYKNEDPASVTPPTDSEKNQSNPESGFLGMPGDTDQVIALSHPREKRKSRIKVVASSSEDEKERKKQTKSVPPVVRRRKSRSGQANKRASGVVYTVSQELDVESDSGVNDTKTILRKVVQASENARKSLVIHESDTEVETKQILIEKASTVRRKTSIKRRERNARRRLHSGNNNNDNNNNKTEKSQDTLHEKIQEFNDIAGQMGTRTVRAVTSSVQCAPTATISVVDSKSNMTTVMKTVQSPAPATVVSTSANNSFVNSNANNSNNISPQIDNRTKDRPVIKNHTKTIPTGKVRGLIERLRGYTNTDVIVVSSGSMKSPVTTPTFSSNPKETAKRTTDVKPRDTSSTNHAATACLQPGFPAVTTESLQLDLTSGSESEDESSPTVVDRVKRLSIPESESNREEFDKAKQASVYLRRSFSHDQGNTRRTTNLRLEAQFGSTETSDQPDEHKFEGVESGGEPKQFLFEKLCLGPPGGSKVTDVMSEEFEHVCSDLENNRLNSVDSHAFSADENEGSNGFGKYSRRTTPVKASKREATKSENTQTPKSGSTEDSKIAMTSMMADDVTKPKICDVTHQDNNKIARSRRYGSQLAVNALPSRTDSMKSTRSEYLPSRRDSEARGRAARQQRRLPAKDMHAIPQMNVARLARKFDENSSPGERIYVSTPRRSKSVGGVERAARRRGDRQARTKTDSEDAEKGSVATQAPTPTSAPLPRGRDENRNPSKHAGAIARIEKAEIKSEEVEFCRSIDYSAKLLTATPTEEEGPGFSPVFAGDDDVFSKSPRSPNKKVSLIEMFAAIPAKKSKCKKDESGKPDIEPDTEDLESRFSSNARVELVRTPDTDDGEIRFETKVSNSPAEKPRPLSKHKSWSSLTQSADQPRRRTRMRSSSLSRDKMRAAMSPQSSI